MLILGGVVAISSATAAEIVVGSVPTRIEQIPDPRLRNALTLYSPNYNDQSRESQIAQYNFVYQQQYADEVTGIVSVPQPVTVFQPAVVPESPAYYSVEPPRHRYYNDWGRDYRRSNGFFNPARIEQNFEGHRGGPGAGSYGRGHR